MFEVIFDVETKKFFDETGTNNPADLGVSLVSLYFRQLHPDFSEKTGEMHSFWEHQFSDMWGYFQQADRIIGFNSISFDVPALKPYSPAGFAKLPHFDILNEVYKSLGRRYSLDSFSKQTLGRGKIDSGANAVKYWQSADPKLLHQLQSYCEADVALTRDLYDYALKNNRLRYIDHWNTPRELTVNFSYPQNAVSEKQISLF
jgi:DEAD/DEAH box helicase domain-containing protein